MKNNDTYLAWGGTTVRPDPDRPTTGWVFDCRAGCHTLISGYQTREAAERAASKHEEEYCLLHQIHKIPEMMLREKLWNAAATGRVIV